MTVRTAVAIWQPAAQLLHVRLRDRPAGQATRTLALSLRCWVSFDEADEVCGVDLHDVPSELAGHIPHYPGADIIGRPLLDDGWLWIPLSGRSTRWRRVGDADLELILDDQGLAALTLHFRSGP